jgi:hypothetical protein
MGSDLFLYFQADGDAAEALARRGSSPGMEPSGSDTIPMVARVDTASEAAEDAQIELTFDPDHLYLFDAETGHRLLPENV